MQSAWNSRPSVCLCLSELHRFILQCANLQLLTDTANSFMLHQNHALITTIKQTYHGYRTADQRALWLSHLNYLSHVTEMSTSPSLKASRTKTYHKIHRIATNGNWILITSAITQFPLTSRMKFPKLFQTMSGNTRWLSRTGRLRF